MKLCFYVDEVTPHLLPLAEAMVERLGSDEVRYVYTKYLHKERTVMGWREVNSEWVFHRQDNIDEAERWILGCDVLFCRLRDTSVWEQRARLGKITMYMSERWFRPRYLFTLCGKDVMLPGWICIFKPGFFSMMYRVAKLFKRWKSIMYLPAGIYAAQDMSRLCGLFAGRWKCLFNAPRLHFDSFPLGSIWNEDGEDSSVYCLDKMRMWAYFVAPSLIKVNSPARFVDIRHVLRIIWVGRMVGLKRIDVLIQAVLAQEIAWLSHKDDTRFELDVYGDGPKKSRLQEMSKGCGAINFYQPVAHEQIRAVIKSHDVLVLSSNGEEGWGAVVNEALEEGVEVIGTYEAGASATMLDKDHLFHSGDWRALLKKLHEISSGVLRRPDGFDWTVEKAADALMHEMFS